MVKYSSILQPSEYLSLIPHAYLSLKNTGFDILGNTTSNNIYFTVLVSGDEGLAYSTIFT